MFLDELIRDITVQGGSEGTGRRHPAEPGTKTPTQLVAEVNTAQFKLDDMLKLKAGKGEEKDKPTEDQIDNAKEALERTKEGLSEAQKKQLEKEKE